MLCRAIWMHSITAPLECAGVLYEMLFQCCKTNMRIPLHSGTRSLKTDSANTLNAAPGTNLNSVPTMLHTGPRVEHSFEVTELNLHRSVLQLKKKKKKAKPQKNPPANLWWLHLLLHLHHSHSPVKTSKYVDWLYFNARDALQVLLIPYLSQGLDNCASHFPVPKTGKLNHPSCCIYCAPQLRAFLDTRQVFNCYL